MSEKKYKAIPKNLQAIVSGNRYCEPVEMSEKNKTQSEIELPRLKSEIVEQCKEVLLKQLLPVKYENDYPDVAVPKSIILMLPALMEISADNSTISSDNSKVNAALVEENVRLTERIQQFLIGLEFGKVDYFLYQNPDWFKTLGETYAKEIKGLKAEIEFLRGQIDGEGDK